MLFKACFVFSVFHCARYSTAFTPPHHSIVHLPCKQSPANFHPHSVALVEHLGSLTKAVGTFVAATSFLVEPWASVQESCTKWRSLGAVMSEPFGAGCASSGALAGKICRHPPTTQASFYDTRILLLCKHLSFLQHSRLLRQFHSSAPVFLSLGA